jgi:mannose-1-phosphate guanylyltransferase/mannose-6-phosphate isomerase
LKVNYVVINGECSMSFRPVILCGGSGTRLWPMSRKSMPKQFLPLFKNKTLLDLTLERLLFFKNVLAPICVASKSNGFLVKEALIRNKVSSLTLMEPEGKNTTASIYLAAKASAPSDTLLIMSSDGLIEDNKYFADMVNEALITMNKEEWIVCGIKPSYPATKYGYIDTQKNTKNQKIPTLKVTAFKEKPNINLATSMIKKGTYFWNAGIFMGNTSMILKSIQKHAPSIAKQCDKVFEKRKDNIKNEINFDKILFNKIPSESIDYAVMEKANNISLIPLTCSWDDIGSWDAFSKIDKSKRDSKKIIRIDTKNSYIKTDKRLIATIGVEDLIIIDNDNATLITKKGHAEKVKKVVEKLNEQKLPEGVEHTFEHRPWGKFSNLHDSNICKVKKIEVYPKHRLSLQFHNRRSEHWLVIKGKANIHIDGVNKVVKSGESVDIPKKSHHYIENKTSKPLIIIETQLGDYFGEDDIVRLDDPYER